MSKSVLNEDNHWGSSMLLGVKFVFKDKVVAVPEVTSEFTDLQGFSQHHKYDFDLEREVLKVCEAAECEEGQESGGCKVHSEDNGRGDLPFLQPTHQLTMIEPKKTIAASNEPALSQSQPLLDRSLVEDFEVQGLRDDPFVAAELGTINDLEELRDVLASMPMPSTTSVDAERQQMFCSLKNINFPRLSVDEDALNHTPSSAPTSQPNLFSQSPVQVPEEPAKSSVGVDTEFHISHIAGSVDSDLSSFRKSANSAKFDIHDEILKSKDFGTGSQPQLFERAECILDEGRDFLSSRNAPTASPPSSPYQNALRVPISVDEGARSNPSDSPTLSEYVVVTRADDPPIVPRLVKMGFRRSKILALLHTAIGGEDDDTIITQLCNWNELEERGFKEEVGKAAVIFAPDDFAKASTFATTVSELSEMGFPLGSVISAVRSSSMDKEEAILRLLDSEKHSDAMPYPNCASNNAGFPRGNILEAVTRQVGRKCKKKEKKLHLSSYLHARH